MNESGKEVQSFVPNVSRSKRAYLEGKATVGDQLKLYKEKHELTSVALSKILRISEAYLSQVLSGKRVGRRKVLEWADLLGMAVEYLLDTQVFVDVRGYLMTGGVVNMVSRLSERVEITNLPNIRTVQGVYALRVTDDLLPFAKRGDILLVKEDYTGIKYGDKFVSWNEKEPRVRYVQGITPDTVVLACVMGLAPALILGRTKDLGLHKIIYHIHE
jgi:transcriptional regulator with XRE-family HTH domain